MCVIMLVSKARPSEEMVERAWDHNKDGAGFAWREGDEVFWEKGVMTLPRAKELAANLPLPYVAHFRVASVGGVKESLTHPFSVSKDVKLELAGKTKGAVLFHNGHWSAWSDKTLDAAIHSNNKVPEGSDWSDSRAMAWLVHIYGPGFMELLTSQKGVLMTPRKFNIFTGNGWEKINEVWCSNDYFWKGRGYRNVGHYRKLCSIGKCTNNSQHGKDICESCERETKAMAAEVAGSTASTSGDTASVGQSQPSAVGVATGGIGRPLAHILTMSEVETLYKNGYISKGMLKKYRKANGSILEKGNRGDRARKAMGDLSQDIAERLLAGCND